MNVALPTLISAAAAGVSATFAAIAWWSWRSQFRMSFPYIDAHCERAENALMIYWSKQGGAASDWTVESVGLKGKVGEFATYRVRFQPNHGREYVQAPEPAGRVLDNPDSPLCLIRADDIGEVVIVFRLRSKTHGSLRQRRKMALKIER